MGTLREIRNNVPARGSLLPTTTLTTAEQAGNRAAYFAAVALGRQAWQAGQHVEAALTAAGYAKYVVDGVLSYFDREGYDEAPPLTQTSQGASQGMSHERKRPRTSSTTTVPVAKSVKKYVKKTVDRLLDDKYSSATITDSAVSTSGVVSGTLLAGITQGTTDTARIGNHIRIKEITFRGIVADTVNAIFRIIILWDRQPNGALPAFGEIISSGSVTGMYNHDTVVGCGGQRFSVLYDKTLFNTCKVAGATDSKLAYFRKKVDKVVTYDANAGAITDLVSNNLIVAYICNAATGDLSATWEVCFVDA